MMILPITVSRRGIAFSAAVAARSAGMLEGLRRDPFELITLDGKGHRGPR